jgi:diacylglycerol kinase family enzyme
MSTQHIGAAGELLVQYQLLKMGIDSARMTTDAGVDLVVCAAGDGSAFTVHAGKGQHERQAVGWTRPAIAGLVLS